MSEIESKRIKLTDAVAGIQEMIDYWRSKIEGTTFPNKSEIHPWEIREKLGRVCLLEIEQDPLDFIYRLDGSNNASAVSEDMTGKSVKLVTPESYATSVLADLITSHREAEPTLWEVAINYPPAIYSYQRVILPLLDEQDVFNYVMTFSWCLETEDGIFPWNRSYGKPES